MAYRLIRTAGRRKLPLFSPLSSYQPKTLIQQQSQPSLHQRDLNTLSKQTRGGGSYVSEMRKSAFEGNICRLIRNEVQYELDHRPPSTQGAVVFNSFSIDWRTGKQWISLDKKFEDKEVIKVEVSMLGGLARTYKNTQIPTADDLELYFPMVVDISKEKSSDVLEFECTVWEDCVIIKRVFMRGQDRMACQPYAGPPFDDLDNELQKSLYEFLEIRGINDDLGAFLHQNVQNKYKDEYIRWLGNVKSFVEKK